MKTYAMEDILPLVKCHGRTTADGEGIWFNWTCSGLSLRFHGSVLRAKLLGRSEVLPGPGNSEQEPPRDYPCVGTVAEDGETLIWRAKCSEGEAWYPLFEGDPGEHSLRLVKLSENMRGKACLLALETDGELLPVSENAPRLSIEFVGDSITCGFGNEASHRDAPFDTAEENGWETYGAAAARQLGAEFNMISVSGISTAAPKRPMFPGRQMEEVYPFRDVYGDELLGREPALWNFAEHRKDLLVLNLGTNDVNPVRFYQDLAAADEEEAWFEESYLRFLKRLRELNGPQTVIVCALGPLDHYLWDRICHAAERYRKDTGDERICLIKLIGVNLMTEGWGAVGHPSKKTHERMGRELAARLQEIIQRFSLHPGA